MHFKGERGHTLRGGLPNVTRGVARAIDQIYDISIPTEPPEKNTRLNIAMIGGGRVYNHKSEDAWFSVDLRSMDNDILSSVKKEIFDICEKVAEEEGLESWVEPYSEIPAGQIPGARDSDLVRVAEEATRFLGVEPRLRNSGSSNMNVGVAKGVPSISTGGNRGGGRDTPDEYANIDSNLNGVKLSFLIAYTLLDGKL
jgi:acetylornithine deacetylase/succinyl-diaminopimelate desuccinylase-like protein